MLLRLLLIFPIVPIMELVILLELSKLINVLPTIATVLVTGIIGAWLTKMEGRYVLYRIQAKFKVGQLPGEELVEGGAVFIAGALLITPGILTDTLGFILLLPVTRKLIARYFLKVMKKKIRDSFKDPNRIYTEYTCEENNINEELTESDEQEN